jgi:tetratricopeptide (TPR) repeat protein
LRLEAQPMKLFLSASLLLGLGLTGCVPSGGQPMATPSLSSSSASPTPDGSEALITAADELQKDGRVNEARYAYNAALEKFPNNTIMLTNRASCESYMADYDAAISDLEKVRSIQQKAGKKKEEAEAFINLAMVYAREKKDPQSVSSLDAAIPLLTECKQDTLLAAARFYRGGANLKMKKLEPALEDFTAAIKLEPKDPNLFAARSKVLELLHQPAKAAADLEEAIPLVKEPATADALRKEIKKLKKQR